MGCERTSRGPDAALPGTSTVTAFTSTGFACLAVRCEAETLREKPMYGHLALFAAFVFAYSAVAGRLERTPFGGAITYTAFGLAFGSLGLGLLALHVDGKTIGTLAELTLALVLFTDAANADLPVLMHNFRLPQRLLLIGLPLSILLGFGVGVIVFDTLTLFELAILATMLAPTDAALGKAVITNKAVPASIREGLNVESGLNDGICVPILFLFLALATGPEGKGWTAGFALRLVAQKLGIGLVVGVGLTLLAGWALKACAKRGWVTKTWRQLPVVALTLACFALAESVGGSGFIASFAGGLLFGALARHQKHELLLAAEVTGDTLALATWVIFGAAIVGLVIEYLTWSIVIYSVLSLTLVRMLPVFISLSGLGMQSGSKLFLAWFGPRGLASIVFGVIVLAERPPGGEILATTVVCTVCLSILAHGLTANALAAALGGKKKAS